VRYLLLGVLAVEAFYVGMFVLPWPLGRV